MIDNPATTKQFLQDFSNIEGYKILVHGGGKVATQVAEKLGIATQMIDGRRITDLPMLEVVTMVYGGLVNKNIVAQLQALQCNALGLTGADGGIILAKKREKGVIDYGFAGDIIQVNARQMAGFLSSGFVPIIAPLTYDARGQMLNTNADTMAATLATALARTFEVSLIYCFEKKGVLAYPNDDNSAIAQLSHPQYTQLKAEGIVSKGMIPKLDNAFGALQQGVAHVVICQAEELKQLATSHTYPGTQLILA